MEGIVIILSIDYAKVIRQPVGLSTLVFPTSDYCPQTSQSIIKKSVKANS